MRSGWTTAALAVWLHTSAAHALPAERLPADAWRVDAQTVSMALAGSAQEPPLDAPDASPPQLLIRVQALCRQPDALAAEAALSRWLDRLAGAAALEAGQSAALAALAECPSRVYVRHEETAGDWWLPAFSNAARARALLRREARSTAAATAAAKLAREGLVAWEAGWDRDFIRAVLAAMPAEARARLAAAKSPPALLALALGLEGSPRSARQALENAPEAELFGVLAPLFAAIPEDQRFEALDAVIARAGLASAALLQTADWPASRRLDARWLAGLDDPAQGPAVAQVLARRWTGERLAEALRTAREPTRQLHLALALRLQDTPQARQALSAMAASGTLPAHLAAELQR